MNSALKNARWSDFEVDDLAQKLHDLRSRMSDSEARFSRRYKLNGECGESARNLIHYLVLREQDLRDLQDKLSALGLSSLGRCEPHVIPAIDRVLAVLDQLTSSPAMISLTQARTSAENWKAVLQNRTAELLGPKPPGRNVRIMVTIPTEAAWNYELVCELVHHGMDCMRINCAYDDVNIWTRMIANLKRARTELQKPCSLLMDVPGPKVRTGPMEPGLKVIKVRPHRNQLGRVTAASRIWLTPAENSTVAPAEADATLHMPADWLAQVSAGDKVKFEDARSSNRTWKITAIEGNNRWAEAKETAYIVPETELRLRKPNGDKSGFTTVATATPQDIPASEQFLHLKIGDTLVLTVAGAGSPASYDNLGHLLKPATIPVMPPQALGDIRPGEAVWFDDGRIGGIARSAAPSQVTVEITYAGDDGEKLGANKGINLPDTDLHLPALTARDLEILEFIVKNADMVGYSFAQNAAGVHELQERLSALGGDHLGIILKIETRKAFEHLPELLLAGLERPKIGVMIARGDLAVECGFERLAEVQEEILWMCEAAHVPVVWATQVLEKLAKEGMPSRAEITDAAMSSRAECVMLNKGVHIIRAVRSLDDILRRMEAHQAKKISMLRRLRLATEYARSEIGPMDESIGNSGAPGASAIYRVA